MFCQRRPTASAPKTPGPESRVGTRSLTRCTRCYTTGEDTFRTQLTTRRSPKRSATGCIRRHCDMERTAYLCWWCRSIAEEAMRHMPLLTAATPATTPPSVDLSGHVSLTLCFPDGSVARRTAARAHRWSSVVTDVLRIHTAVFPAELQENVRENGCIGEYLVPGTGISLLVLPPRRMRSRV